MSHQVLVLQTDESFEVEDDESVLEAALRQNVRLAHECTFGGCGSCRVKLVSGAVSYEEMPLALTQHEAEQGYALVCQARAGSDLVISTEGTPAQQPEPRRAQAVVKQLQQLTPEVVQLSLALADGAPFDFQPGQHLNVLLDDGSHRSFSMASAPLACQVDLHVRRIPGGRFTGQQLAQLRVGDRLEVELPLGNFQLDRAAYRPLVMVATGTGLAPIKTMLESLLDDPDCPPVWLYWGMRTEADLYLDAQLRAWAPRLYEFQYVPVLSRAHAGWQGRRGHVQDAVLEALPDLSEHAIYLCGSPAMINEAKTQFLAHGASLQHLHSDGFSFQHHA